MDRKVRFGNVTVHTYLATQEEIACRNIYWELFALDRIRFQNRIEEMEVILSPLLLKQFEASKKYKRDKNIVF